MNSKEVKNNAYTAITIGPIGKTLAKARSVKSFWTASYLFSWIMRELLKKLPEENFEVLSPHRAGKDVSEETSKKVGLFPDRLFAKGELEEKEFKRIKREIFGELAEKFKNAFQDEKDDIARKIDTERDPKRKRELEEIKSRYSNATSKSEDIRKYLENYLSISSITVELSSDCSILEQLNKYLDTQELFNKASSHTDEDYMELFIEASKNSFLEDYSKENTSSSGSNKDLKESSTKKRAFPSTSEIAVSGWEQNPPKDANGEVDYSKLTSKTGFRNCYKYLAVIKADGDGFGTYIKELKVDEEKEIKENGEKENELTRFTKSFFEFSVEVANELIQKTKAIPVYIGGDDLFLFAPVLEGNVEKDVFNLIKEIDDLFIQKEIGEGLSMSYGVSIFYYKSPMSEAIDIADSMLRKAKEEKEEKEKKKDTVAISIQKHSGQKIEFLLPCKHSSADETDRKESLYGKTVELVRAFKDDGNMLNSLIYWIEEMYEILFIEEVTQSQERINAVFDNFFDEEIHKENEVFFDLLKKFIHSMHHSEDTPRKLKDKKKLLHGILRYCQFVTAKKEK
ncbi:type III-B CRISPR-associated protein Cas10/Cmr2 [Porphyromonas gingivalis]|uniref:type III-B CRISPR-associated protein Cas10/Cmr2 n=1 Tax=Porphyromonas gingivalis TaxID=837 RepID=UPI000C1A3AEE|nr:type III-B CRISPR-associated protein Cas10/Cmr2 [Porphyromonas gingivalis]ATR94404.1 type III-B CRISPR-associated protein Cas10/Cmr2 [Porphyromonas gingivalis]ATR97505.1 type III-B CRISPR-associated protein Cas10/Cmr2 [Porphyromonas gingivalis]